MNFALHPLSRACLLALPFLAQPALAQQATPADKVLPAATVSASPLGTSRDEMGTPVSVLADEELVSKRAATLGETLEGEPGISASHFGAGASRPIIRGMDGARVRVMSDGAEVMDASTISPDHAVGVEPMLSTQIEVLRGPSALAYGGGAIGGVVNVLDERVPTAIPENGRRGSVELRGASAAREGAVAASVTAGGGQVALHAEGLKRYASDYRVGDGWSGGDKLLGSDSRSESGSFGMSWIGDRGYIGLAVSSISSRYGLPGHSHEYEGCHTHDDSLHCGGHDEEEEGDDDDHDHDHGAESAADVPRIKLDSLRWDLRGELRDPLPGFTKARLRAAVTDYQHDEVEDGTVMTTFKNKAHDGRLELEHKPIAGWRGVLGLQGSARDFSAEGEEAYIVPTETRRQALFLTEEYRLGAWRFEAALRQEWQQIDAQGELPDRDHRGTSLSVGANWKFAPAYQLSASLTRAQRLPTAEELYADGLHLATRTYERGDVDLDKETSLNLDVGVRKLSGPTTFSLGAYYNRVRNYIYARTLDELDGLQLIQYSQHDAVFTGLEGQVRQALNRHFGVALFGDYVRGKLSGDGGNLPRIPAARAGVRLDANLGGWEGLVETYRVSSQDKLADYETRTPGYTMLNLGVSRSLAVGDVGYQFYVRLNNLTNELAYAHTSFIKDAAPLTGRNLVLGLRASF